LRSDALDRLARGLDIDPSMLSGKENLNHWNTYAVDAQFATQHVQPPCDLLADFLTFSYLRPMLEVFEDVDPDDTKRFRLVSDPSPILARSDEATSSRVLHDLELLKDETTVKSNGFDPGSDMPDEAELLVRRAWKLLQSHPDLGPVLGPLIPGFETLDWSAATPPQPGAPGAPPAAPAPPPSPIASNGDAAPRLGPTDAESGMEQPPVPGGSAMSLIDRVVVAADAAVDRAFERAGARVVNRAKRDHGLRDRLGAVQVADKGRVLTLIRPTELTSLGFTVDGLLSGEWESFGAKCRTWVRLYLEDRGRPALVADDMAALASSPLVNSLSLFAASNLHRPLMVNAQGVKVPVKLVEAGLASAGVI